MSEQEVKLAGCTAEGFKVQHFKKRGSVLRFTLECTATKDTASALVGMSGRTFDVTLTDPYRQSNLLEGRNGHSYSTADGLGRPSEPRDRDEGDGAAAPTGGDGEPPAGGEGETGAAAEPVAPTEPTITIGGRSDTASGWLSLLCPKAPKPMSWSWWLNRRMRDGLGANVLGGGQWSMKEDVGPHVALERLSILAVDWPADGILPGGPADAGEGGGEEGDGGQGDDAATPAGDGGAEGGGQPAAVGAGTDNLF